MPDFQLRDVAHFKKKNASLSDFRGKWLFLDLWYQGCSSCITSLRKVNAIYEEFASELNWVIVAVNTRDLNKGVEELYKKLERKQNLQLPVAFDSILLKKWKVHAFPHIIVVNPQGVVYAITNGRDLNREKMQNLVAGNPVSFYPKERDDHDFDPVKTLSANEPSWKNRIRSFSLFTKGDREHQWILDIHRWAGWPQRSRTEGFRLAMLPLGAMYNIAWFGKWRWSRTDSLLRDQYPEPVLEVRDTSLFSFSYRSYPATGVYNYIQYMPEEFVTPEHIMTTMQQDLLRSFKFDVTLETRPMPVWKLVARPTAEKLLSTKGGDQYATEGNVAAGFTLKNYPMTKVLDYLTVFLSADEDAVFFDETGITSHIDMTMDADMTNIEDVNRSLSKYGLQIVRGTKEMKVMVIRDRK
jgi:peroxiredoxin